MHQGQVLVPLPGIPQKTKLHNFHPGAEGIGQSIASSIVVHPESMSSLKFRSAVSMGFPIIILTISPPNTCSLQLDFPISAQFLAVDLGICFHQVLDESFRMATRAATNLITGEGQFSHPLHYCYES